MSDFEQFWNTYDNKKSRDKVERKWHTMSAKDRIACMDSLPKYIESTPEKQYRKHPATYLNNKSWNDVIYGEEKEEKGLYKTPDQPTFSNYKSDNTPTEEQRDTFIKGKIKLAYEGKIHLNDHGSVYTNRLEKFFNTPPLIKDQINQAVKELDEMEPSNRFEEIVEINVELECRNRVLRYNIKIWQSEQRHIYLEL